MNNIKAHLPAELPEAGYKGAERRAINQLIRALRRAEIISTPTTRIRSGPNGTAIEVVGVSGESENLPRWL